MLVPKMRPFTRSLRLQRKFISPQFIRIESANNSTSSLSLDTKHITTVPGVKLSDHQEAIVRSVLDLFAGRPSLPKLALWRDDATFINPLTSATGREKYSAQWYGLQKAFSEIDCINHQVRDAGNPILIDSRIKYTVRGLGTQQLLQSEVAVHLDEEGKISKVQDKWNGELSEGVMSNVSPREGVCGGLLC
jgi:hypothetical protein